MTSCDLVDVRRDYLLEAGARHGSVYVYDLDEIWRRVAAVRHAFPSFGLLYSLKANPNPAICRFLWKAGVGAEVASVGELRLAVATGCPPERVTYAGPAKHPRELREASDLQIGAIHVESEAELHLALDLRRSGPSFRHVGIRVNTATGPADRLEIMAGGPSRFGIDEEHLLTTLASHLRTEGAVIDGLHIYSASQVQSVSDLVAGFQTTSQLAADYIRIAGQPLRYIDYGGGFGVPYQDEPELDLNDLAARVGRVQDSYSDTLGDVDPVWELGRYLVATAGFFVTQVVDVKHSRGTVYVMTDSGINGFLRPAFTGQAHRVVNLSRPGEPDLTETVIGGRLCTPLDVLSRQHLPPTHTGDTLAVCNAGAYGWSMSPHFFLGHDLPAEVVLSGTTMTTIRERISPDRYHWLGVDNVG